VIVYLPLVLVDSLMFGALSQQAEEEAEKEARRELLAAMTCEELGADLGDDAAESEYPSRCEVELEEASLVETYTDDDGKAAMRLTEQGEQIARQTALSGEDDAAALLEALLEAAPKPPHS